MNAADHARWDSEPPNHVSMDWGTSWATGALTLLAEVPSAIVPEEVNVLINPRHPDAALLTARKIRKWTHDGNSGR